MEQDLNVIEGRIEAVLFSVGEAVERERIHGTTRSVERIGEFLRG